jgi:uncharacterized membrane protein
MGNLIKKDYKLPTINLLLGSKYLNMKIMNEQQINTMINIFYGISTMLVLTGAFFKLQHYPNGILILLIGFMLGSVISAYETSRLKKKIKRLEEQINQTH